MSYQRFSNTLMLKFLVIAVWIIRSYSITIIYCILSLRSILKMDNFNEKTEFYQKMEKYYLDKPGKKPYTSEKIESIIMEINDAKST